jgi:hypothetical protein
MALPVLCEVGVKESEYAIMSLLCGLNLFCSCHQKSGAVNARAPRCGRAPGGASLVLMDVHVRKALGRRTGEPPSRPSYTTTGKLTSVSASISSEHRAVNA